MAKCHAYKLVEVRAKRRHAGPTASAARHLGRSATAAFYAQEAQPPCDCWACRKSQKRRKKRRIQANL